MGDTINTDAAATTAAATVETTIKTVIKTKASGEAADPAAASAFVFGQLLLDPSIVGSSDLLMGMVILLFATPILHRSFNIIGYRLGLKSVPY